MRKILLYIACACFIASCTERIDINTTTSPPRIVIYGKLTTDTVRQSISITKSTGYFAVSKPEGIMDAIVWITTDDAEFQLFPRQDGAGVYETLDELACIEGKDYQLSIQVDFNEDGEDEFYTASSFLPPAVQMDTITFAQSILADELLEVKLTAVLPEINDDKYNYFSLYLYRNEELVNDSLRGMSIYSDETLDTRYINELSCFFLPQDKDDSRLEPGDSISIRVDAVTKEYATFISNAQSESMGSIPLFSGPPANVETNIRCSDPSISPLGFFSAHASRRTSCIYNGLSSE